MAKHTRQIEEKNSELRELKVELDRERMEKQFLAEENTRVKNERRRLEADKSDLLIRVRDLTDGCRSHDNSAVDSDLSEQYHTLLQEHKEQEKYLATVQQQLYQVRQLFYKLLLSSSPEKLLNSFQIKQSVSQTSCLVVIQSAPSGRC